MVACEFSGFCRRYWSMRRRAGSCILVPGPPRRAPIGARASRETRNVNRPRSVVRFQRLRLMHLKTAHRPPPTAHRPSVFRQLQVPGLAQPDRGRPPFQMHQNNPRGPPGPPARGTIDRWQLAATARTELRLEPVPAAKGASTTDDERLLCCTLSRFCMLGCSTRKLLSARD